MPLTCAVILLMAAVSSGVELLVVAGALSVTSSCLRTLWVAVAAAWKLPRLAAVGWER